MPDKLNPRRDGPRAGHYASAMTAAPHDWDDLYAPPPAASFRRAAVSLWVTGALFALLGGACGLMFAAIGTTPIDEVIAQGDGQFSEAQADALRQFHPFMLGVAAVLGVILFLPGLLMLVLGFPVKGRVGWAVTAALVVAGLETILIGLAGLSSLVNAVLAADVTGILTVLVIFGVAVGLLIWTLGRLLVARRALKAKEPGYTDDDPWETAI